MCQAILIVDDDAMNREIIDAFLSLQHYETLMAHDGESAWEMLQREKPCLVVTDVKMYDMSGFELCQRIKSAPHLQGLPVMIVSGYNSPEDESQARAVGADDFLARPLDYLDFMNRVKALLNRGEASV